MLALALALTAVPQAAKPAPTVLLFVLPDCPIARKYAPEMQRIQKEYSVRGVVFTIVHVDPHISEAKAKAFAKEFGYPRSYLVDAKHKLAKKTGVTNVPTAAVLQGEEVRYVGRIDDRFPELGVQRSAPKRQDLRIALDEVLAGKPVTVKKTQVVGCLLPTL